MTGPAFLDVGFPEDETRLPIWRGEAPAWPVPIPHPTKFRPKTESVAARDSGTEAGAEKMLTVKYVYKGGETVKEVVSVTLDLEGGHPVVTAKFPPGSDAKTIQFGPIRDGESTTLYVMNDNGATVATYRL
jgi:hypothetical protein